MDREAIARIIDPERWTAFDLFGLQGDETNIGLSLAKADAILALASPTGDAVEAAARALANYFTDRTLIKRHERGISDKGPAREAEAKEWYKLRELFGVRGAMPANNARGVIRKKLAAAIAAMPPVLPEGWVAVPRELPEAMLDAYWAQTGESREMRLRIHAYMRRYWSAMLAAAPSPDEGERG